jgi:glycosyltransferase involved in cell wall biosynthesis
MNVLLIGNDPSFFDEASEARKRMREYAKAIGTLHVVSLCGADYRGSDEVKDGTLSLHAVRPLRFFEFHSLEKRAKAMNAVNAFDVISALDPFECGRIARNIAHGTRAKLHIQVHTDFLSPWFTRNVIARSPQTRISSNNRVRQRIADQVLPHADGIRVVSKRVQDSLLAHYEKTIPTPKLIPLEISTVLPPKADLPEHKMKFVFMTIGPLVPEKRIEDILVALVRIKERYPSIGLMIIGDGPERKRLEHWSHVLKLDDCVLFLGDRPDAVGLLQNAHAYIQASAYEGYAPMLIEAALARVPIITTDVGVVGEVFKGYEDVLTTPPGDPTNLSVHMMKLLEDVPERQQIEMVAERTARMYLGTVHAGPEAIANDFRELLSKGKGSVGVGVEGKEEEENVRTHTEAPKRTLKILIATPLYPPDTGGPATDSAMLKNELPKHGIEVEVCSFGQVRHLPTGIRHLCYVWELLATSRRAGGVDVIIAMDTFSVCWPALIVARLLRKPFVVRVPGDFVWEQSVQRFGVTDSIKVFQGKRYDLKIETLRWLQKFTVRRADLVVAISDFLKSIIAQWGFPPANLKRIYLGLDFSEEAIKPHDIPEGKILFTLGRFVPWKGFSMFIELLPELPEEWHLIIAGDGPLRSSLQDLAHKLEVSKRVTFTGIVPHAEALGWYEAADAFVLNTSFESFSFQVLEAMASGKPVITTNIGSLPELITSGVEGVLCTPDDKEAFKKAILSTQSERDLWRERGQAAKQKAHSFSAEASTREFAEALKQLCG